MARLLLGVSGGIAAYKALETARLAVRAGHAVRVIQTPASERFVGRASFAALTGAPVLRSEFEPDPARGAYPGEPVPERTPISHLALVERAEVLLIAPATANTVAKLAHGLADNLLSTAALAAACPVLVAPAMNDRMYRHPATRENLGRLAEPEQLLEAVETALAGERAHHAWRGVRVLVTAGGTREPIDSVRYVGNRSSGRMGAALAARAAARGAEVSMVCASMSVPPPPGVRVRRVQTAAELQAACQAEFPRCQVLLMAAAVADFRPAAPVAHKLKKDAGLPRTIELEPTEDVLLALAGSRRPDQVVVGFAAEHGEQGLASARQKLARKRLDAIVVNDVSRSDIGFEA